MLFDKSLLITIFTIAWPTMFQQAAQTFVQYADTGMIGVIGTKALAAVGATSTVNWLIDGTMSAFGIGFLAYVSQALGAGKFDLARRSSVQAIIVVIGFGLLIGITALSLSSKVPELMQVQPSIRTEAFHYFFILSLSIPFRMVNITFGALICATKDTKTPMLITLFINLLNVVLNFYLIYSSRTWSFLGINIFIPGLGYGVSGAALASSISYIIGSFIFIRTLFKNPKLSPIGIRFRPDWIILKSCFKISIPVILQRFTTTLGYVAFSALINTLGEVSIAANSVANTVESAFYIPGWGMQTAAATLAGNFYGEKNFKELTNLPKVLLPLELILMSLSGAILFFSAHSLVCIFSSDPNVIRLGTIVLQIVAVSEPFYGIPIVLEGLMDGVGKTVMPFIFNLIGMWAVRIVGTFICLNYFHLGLIAAWSCMVAHNIFLFFLFIFEYYSGRWLPGEIR